MEALSQIHLIQYPKKIVIVGGFFLALNAFYNSMYLHDKSAFHLSSHHKVDVLDQDISFASSAPSRKTATADKEWTSLDKVETSSTKRSHSVKNRYHHLKRNQTVSAIVQKKVFKKQLKAQHMEKVAVANQGQRQKTAAPAISDYLDLSLRHTFYKKPLGVEKSSGHLVMNNGVIEELSVNLGEYGKVEISTHGDQIIGNEFKYLDSLGNEQKGLVYKFREGAYMVTINSGEFSGARFEFWTQELIDQEAIANEQKALEDQQVTGDIAHDLNTQPNEVNYQQSSSGYYKVSPSESTFKVIQ